MPPHPQSEIVQNHQGGRTTIVRMCFAMESSELPPAFSLGLPVVQVVVATPLLQLESSTDCLTIWTPFALLTVANCVVGLALAIVIKSDYRRQELESSFSGTEDMMKLAGAGVVGGQSSALSVVSSWGGGAGLRKGDSGLLLVGDASDTADARGFARLGDRGYGTATTLGGARLPFMAGPVGSGQTAPTTPPAGGGGSNPTLFSLGSSGGGLSSATAPLVVAPAPAGGAVGAAVGPWQSGRPGSSTTVWGASISPAGAGFLSEEPPDPFFSSLSPSGGLASTVGGSSSSAAAAGSSGGRKGAGAGLL